MSFGQNLITWAIKFHFWIKSGGKLVNFRVFLLDMTLKVIYITHFHEMILIACQAIS